MTGGAQLDPAAHAAWIATNGRPDTYIAGPDDEVRPADPDDQLEAELRFHRLVHEEARKLRVRDAAARLIRRENADNAPDPQFVGLGDFLAVDDEPERYRIDRLWPVGGRVVLAAAYKAGKSTARDNLIRALVDHEPFLGHFAVNSPAGHVALIDDELDERMLRRWLREQGVTNTGDVHVLPLRGKVTSFDLLDDDNRARWAKRLREVGAGVVVLDCLRPILDAFGLSEDKDAGRFLVAFDALLTEADVGEGLVVHHAGHNGERSRGDSRLRDWPDVEWRLVREADEEGNSDAAARRFFAAYGRDVDVPEGLLSYDQATRRLTYSGGTRKDTAADAVIPAIVAYLKDNAGASGRAIEQALTPTHRRAHVRLALHRAIEQGTVDTAEGDRRARLHLLPNPA